MVEIFYSQVLKLNMFSRAGTLFFSNIRRNEPDTNIYVICKK